MAKPVTSAWTATGRLTSPHRVADAQLSGAEADDLEVDAVRARQVRLGLGALLLVGGELLVAGLHERVDGLVALLGQFLGVAADDREVLRRLAERPLGLVHAGTLEQRHVARKLLLGLALERRDLVAVLAAVRLGLLLLLLLLRLALTRRLGRSSCGRGDGGLSARVAPFVVVAPAGRDEQREDGEEQCGQRGRACSH